MSIQPEPPQVDPSNGWEAVAAELIAKRAPFGAATVRSWSRALPAGASVLDLGCGSGVPVSQALIDDGFAVSGIDASPSLVAAFQRRFPAAQVACEAVETSDFFGERYDGIVAIGLIFLLQPDVQELVIGRVASALKPGGRFLFTAPTQSATWADVLTGRQSQSLGDENYRRLLADAGLVVIGEYEDEGENHYYDTAHAPPSLREQ
jgi:2-polyprenyl-3-methyl-5-hydroxy-6-metoxy-1,4-benzoquinol methylase